MYPLNMAVGEELRTSMITPNKLVSITYPRHGLHFLKANLTNLIENFDIYFQHEFIHHDGSLVSDSDLILTVVRNPIEAITSEIIAGLEINGGGSNIIHRDIVRDRINYHLENKIASYIDTYNKLNSYKNLMVINFKDLESNPKFAFDYIIKTLNVDKEYDSFTMPESDQNFIATSKGNRFYEYCYSVVENTPDIDNAFTACSLLYNRLYSKIDLN